MCGYAGRAASFISATAATWVSCNDTCKLSVDRYIIQDSNARTSL